jgi:ATP-binding cassette subfamily F protein 3
LQQQKAFDLQQREIKRLQMAVLRIISWSSGGQNEKMVKRARNMQRRIDRIDRIDRPVLERKTMGLDLAVGQRGSNKVLEIKDVWKSFGDNEVLRGVDLLVWHGERVGLVGPNGAGKSVLFKLILGELQADFGSIYLGPSIDVACYAQEHQTLNYDATLVDEIRRVKNFYEREAYGYLGRFLFGKEAAQKKIGVLSGGEKARLQMAKLMLSNANFLLLDEPTNNLDIPSAEVLEEALDDYQGTVLVISHDRYFLDRVAQRVVELEDGRLKEYVGNYTYYAAQKAGGVVRALPPAPADEDDGGLAPLVARRGKASGRRT